MWRAARAWHHEWSRDADECDGRWDDVRARDARRHASARTTPRDIPRAPPCDNRAPRDALLPPAAVSQVSIVLVIILIAFLIIYFIEHNDLIETHDPRIRHSSERIYLPQ